MKRRKPKGPSAAELAKKSCGCKVWDTLSEKDRKTIARAYAARPKRRAKRKK